jgi:transcriptional regulator GlxA family with amidase domain
MYQDSANSSGAMNALGGGSTSSSDLELSVEQLRSAMAELFTAMTSALRDERGPAKECLRRAAAILQAVEKTRAPAIKQVRGGLAPWQVRKVASHVATNLDNPIRSEELAAIVGLNPCHFSRAFRNSFGESPLEYIIRQRMERAQGLMLSTDAPLSRIALDCGLADQAHFSRMFRRIVGESPRGWRRARIRADA